MQTTDFEGKEIFNYITASINGKGSSAPQIDGKPVSIDDSKPITFRRMKYIHAKLEFTLDTDIGKIVLNLAAFEPGEYDGANPKLWEKTYSYQPGGILSVYENGDWFYDEDVEGKVYAD